MTIPESTFFFDFPFRVYYEDTDAGGVVYHANYLKYMERARSEWLASDGFNLHDMSNILLFVVRSAHVEYLKPAYLLDELIVTSSIEQATKTRLIFRQNIIRQHQIIVTGKIEIVCIDSVTRKPRKLPIEIFK